MLDSNASIKDIMQINNEVSELVRKYDLSRTSEEKTLMELSEEKGFDADFFLEVVRMFNDKNHFPKEYFMSFSIAVILDYLRKTHDYYLDTRLLEIEQMIDHLSLKHESPMNDFLRAFFAEFRKELSLHIRFEEKTLFPYIEHLESGTSIEKQVLTFNLRKFIKFHNDDIENKLSEARAVLLKDEDENKQHLPYRILHNMMHMFETDLRIHGKIEDQVLIPMALKLEDQKE